MTNKDISFPYYSGNIHFIRVMGQVSLHNFIQAHKNPTARTLRIMKLVGVADALNLNKLKRKSKHDLFSFTPSVVINNGRNRGYKNIVNYTGLMQLDFDGIETPEKAKEIKEYLFDNYEEIVCSYLSPSMRGVKCLMKITQPRDRDHFRAIHKAASKEFEQIGYFDDATKNAVLPLFLSIDKDIMYKDISDCKTFDEEDWSQVKYVELLDKKTHTPTSNDYDYNRTVRIFRRKMEAIVDNGHPQLRSACLILGSRASAGYIELSEAEWLAEACIDHNAYLQKDINNYKTTALWAIKNGYRTPMYYK